jgi:transposase
LSREHRRTKTDRLDTELLLRVLLGWLRGEKRHCCMVTIPAIEQEGAKRPSRERGRLITEQMRIGNQIKAILTRFGIRNFPLKLRKADRRGDRADDFAPWPILTSRPTVRSRSATVPGGEGSGRE